MANLDDQHYINLVIAGDQNAFAALVDRYKDMVFNLSIKMLKNRELAEEVAQDSFIKAYRSLGTFKSESKFSTWVYKITYNSCLDQLRKIKREQHFVSIDEHSEPSVVLANGIFDRLVDKERRQMIQDCMNLLPGADSFLLTLFYFEEQSLKEIAKILDVNTNHVKIKLFRSRKKLAEILSMQLEPEILVNYESERR